MRALHRANCVKSVSKTAFNRMDDRNVTVTGNGSFTSGFNDVSIENIATLGTASLNCETIGSVLKVARQIDTGSEGKRCKVLVAEDEAVVALDLQMMIEDWGARVLGPCATTRAAMRKIAQDLPDAAVLDVMLADGEVYELADRLRDAGVALVFHSGHADPAELLARYPEASVCPKPAYPSEIEAKLESVLRAHAEAGLQAGVSG